jgi:hypothetical protein
MKARGVHHIDHPNVKTRQVRLHRFRKAGGKSKFPIFVAFNVFTTEGDDGIPLRSFKVDDTLPFNFFVLDDVLDSFVFSFFTFTFFFFISAKVRSYGLREELYPSLSFVEIEMLLPLSSSEARSDKNSLEPDSEPEVEYLLLIGIVGGISSSLKGDNGGESL